MKTTIFIALLVLLTFSSCEDPAAIKAEAQKEIADEKAAWEASVNATIEKFLTGWNEGNYDNVDAVTAADAYRIQNGVSQATDLAGVKAVMEMFRTAFPDAHVAIDNLVIAGKQSFINWTFTGTNSGEFNGAAPTGKSVKISGVAIGTYADDGKFKGEDVFYNELEMMSQLGYTLSPPEAM